MKSLALIALLTLAATARAEEIEGTVTKVHDGDTAHVTTDDGTVLKVRFVLSDAPEIGQPGGNESRDFVADLCLDKEVTVKTEGTDAFGRTLGEIIVDGVNVNKRTIEEGHAWWFYNFDNSDAVEKELGNLLAGAMAAKKGLFAAEAPIYPRAWRRGARLSGSGGGSGGSGGGGSSGGGGGGGTTSGPSSSLFIMAMLPNPRGDDADNETIILANSSDVEASIDGWKLQDDDNGVFTLSGTVPAGGTRTVRLNASLSLGNSGDKVELREPDGDVAQTLQYSSAGNGRFVLAQ